MVETTEEHIKNETERSLVRFEVNRIFSSEWPSGNGGKVIQALGRQLRFAGGFHAHMEVIDLDTPTNVRLDTEKVLGFLKTKPPITNITGWHDILASCGNGEDLIATICCQVLI